MTGPSVAQQVVEVLHRAPDVIREKGWIQGDYQNDSGVCAMGAVDWLIMELPDLNINERIALSIHTGRVIQQAIEPMPKTVPEWNDDPSRTVEDVLLAFKRAEELAAEQVTA